jgi:hypothetical protein
MKRVVHQLPGRSQARDDVGPIPAVVRRQVRAMGRQVQLPGTPVKDALWWMGR